MKKLHDQSKLNKGQERQLLLIASVMVMSSITQCQDERGCLFSQLSLLFALLKNSGQVRGLAGLQLRSLAHISTHSSLLQAALSSSTGHPVT